MKKISFLEQHRRGNKTHIVRSVWTLAAMLTLAAFAAACDPGFNEDMVIRNASSHTVTVVPAPYSYYNSMLDSTLTLTHETYTIAPNDEVVIQVGGGIGAASFELGVCEFMDYYSDSVTFRFVGETNPQIVYYRSDTTGISPFNFNSMNYQYEEDVNNGLIFHGHRSYGKLTFIITDEHYEEAER